MLAVKDNQLKLAESIRYLMRSNATHGSAGFANIPGWLSMTPVTEVSPRILRSRFQRLPAFSLITLAEVTTQPRQKL